MTTKRELPKNIGYRDSHADYGVKRLPGVAELIKRVPPRSYVVEFGCGHGHVSAQIRSTPAFWIDLMWTVVAPRVQHRFREITGRITGDHRCRSNKEVGEPSMMIASAHPDCCFARYAGIETSLSGADILIRTGTFMSPWRD